MIKSNRIIKILLAISLLCIVFSGLSFEKREVFAEQKVVAPTESDSVIQVVEGFVLKDNTSLRLSGRAIKFTSVVIKDFHQEISKNGAVT